MSGDTHCDAVLIFEHDVEKRNTDTVTYWGLLLLFFLWLCPGLLIYLPNNGGSGLAFPFNIISWFVMALAALWLGVRLPSAELRPICATPTMRLLPIGALLWTLPLCWSPSHAVMYESLPHVIALWGLLGFLWLLRRMPLKARYKRWILLIVAASAFLQALFGFVQVIVMSPIVSVDGLHVFRYTRPLGIFQQPNVLASYVASGIMCLLVSKAKGVLAGIALFFMAFMLVLIQSRVGWVAVILGCGVMLVLNWRRAEMTITFLRALILIAAGVTIAFIWQHGWLKPVFEVLFPGSRIANWSDAFIKINKSGSTFERWEIIKTTWQMILQHPLLGTGYGGFEAAFIQQAQLSGGPFVDATLTHPHNELLYAWSEGGLPALIGLLLMVADIIWLLWRRGGWRWEGITLLLPVMVHTNLEYPLYLSAPHLLVLVLLLSVVLAPPSFTPSKTACTSFLYCDLSASHIRKGIVAISLCVLVFMASALQTQQRLTAIEQQGQDLLLLQNGQQRAFTLWNPLSQYQRLTYDRHVALLLDYNLNKNIRDLRDFDTWARIYLTHHNDTNIYISEIKIYSSIYPELRDALCQRARNIWPRDRRFNCYSTFL